ncbi:transporter substrate-binding domain-containing protein [Luteimonas sp. TWI1416]|uniref:transporter substrate-binding domain-containing protein n=1 Tax=unclassified Luteimonas TaxID=2629088 RepID=UPI00320B58A9
MFIRAWFALLLLSLSACDGYPRDAQGSTERARQTLRVGVSHDPPFVEVHAGQAPTGREIELIQAFARDHGYTVEWVEDGHEPLMTALLGNRLHLVVGGHGTDSPWTDVGWSRAFVLRAPGGGFARRRFALPPAENAWQLSIDRYLHARERTLR